MNQSAAAGIRPKVGRTERSHPKTSPMISAPPEVDREMGTPPTLMAEQADHASDDDPRADEDHVGLRGGAIGIAEAICDPAHVALGPDQRQDVAAIELETRNERHLLAATDHLSQKHPPPELAGEVARRKLGDRLAGDGLAGQDHLQDLDRDAQELRILDLVAGGYLAHLDQDLAPTGTARPRLPSPASSPDPPRGPLRLGEVAERTSGDP